MGDLSLSDVVQKWSEVFMHRSMADFKRFMQDSGLSHSQVSTLMRLYHHTSCGVSAVADDLGVTNAAASQMVDRLVQLGVLERSEDPEDRRARQLRLTPKGRSLVEQGIEVRRRWMEDLILTLTPDQQDKISDALSILTQAAQQADL